MRAHGKLLLAAGGAPELQQAGPGPAGQEAAVWRVRGCRYGSLVAEFAALVLNLLQRAQGLLTSLR